MDKNMDRTVRKRLVNKLRQDYKQASIATIRYILTGFADATVLELPSGGSFSFFTDQHGAITTES